MNSSKTKEKKTLFIFFFLNSFLHSHHFIRIIEKVRLPRFKQFPICVPYMCDPTKRCKKKWKLHIYGIKIQRNRFYSCKPFSLLNFCLTLVKTFPIWRRQKKNIRRRRKKILFSSRKRRTIDCDIYFFIFQSNFDCCCSKAYTRYATCDLPKLNYWIWKYVGVCMAMIEVEVIGWHMAYRCARRLVGDCNDASFHRKIRKRGSVYLLTKILVCCKSFLKIIHEVAFRPSDYRLLRAFQII